MKVLALIVIITSLFGNIKTADPEPIDDFVLQDYLGVWYE